MLQLFSQKFANKKDYLVDSIDLGVLMEQDLLLLDTCVNNYKLSKTDSGRIEALAVICENMSDQSWVHYQNLQLEEIYNSIKIKDSYFLQKSLGNAFNNFGYFYDVQGNIKKAKDYYSMSLDQYKKIDFQSGMAIANNNLGYLYQMQGNVLLALDHFHQSLSIAESNNDDFGIAFSCNNLGSLYNNQGDLDKAIEYYEKSLEYERLTENQKGIAICLNNIGYVYNDKGDKERALQFFLQAFEIRQEINDLIGMTNSINNIGAYYLEKKNYPKALEYFYESLRHNKSLGNKAGFVTCYINIGKAFYEQKEYEKAVDFAEKALLLSQELGFPMDIEQSAFLYSNIASSMKNWEVAYEMHVLYLIMRDSTRNEQNTKSTMQLQFQIEYAKKSAADSIKSYDALKLKNAEIATNKANAEKLKIAADSQKKFNYFLIVGLVLVGLFAFALFNRFKHSQSQNKIIAEQNQHSEKLRKKVEHQHLLLEETLQDMSDSIKYAERLQKAILPSNEDLQTNLKDGFVLFKPKDIVSGDFYWMHNTGTQVLIAVADCTGHGVPGAMVSVVCSNALNRSVKEFNLKSPGEILNKTRDLVVETFNRGGQNVRDGMDIALCSISDHKVSFSGANNPIWIIRNDEILKKNEGDKVYAKNGLSLIEFKGNNQPVGFYDSMEKFDQKEIQLYKGDTLYMFTDGFADQFGGDRGKKLMYKPFKNLLLSVNHLSMEKQKQELDQFFFEWRGDNEQVDDVCIIGIKV